MIIWITGISGSGKTTIAKLILNQIKKNRKNVIGIDGDVIRELFGNDLTYDVTSRVNQIKRIQRLSLFLQSQDLHVIVSALYCDEYLLNWNRKNFDDYYEIYLDASIELVVKRDVKGIYKKYSLGLEKNIVGLDIPWNAPKNYDLKIDMNNSTTINETMRIISKNLNILS